MAKYRLENSIDKYAPDEYKRIAWDKLKRDAGIKLYELLEQMPNPAVVTIDEHIEETAYYPQQPLYYPDRERIGIEITVEPVRYEHVTIAKTDPVDWHLPPYPSFMRRLRWLITGK